MADDLEQRSERVEKDIEEAKKDWEGKQKDEQVPGAVPESESESD